MQTRRVSAQQNHMWPSRSVMPCTSGSGSLISARTSPLSVSLLWTFLMLVSASQTAAERSPSRPHTGASKRSPRPRE